MRLIDVSKLVYRVAVDDNDGQIFYVPAEEIDNAPTIDAEPVVRCKDCSHSEKVFPKRNCDLLKCDRCYDFIQPNDFCSYGERKGGDE